MPEINLLEAIHQALEIALKTDPQVVLVGNDIGVTGGIYRASEGLFERFGAERVIETPLSGSALIGVGIGLAMYGLHPICEVQSAEFLFPAFQQIVGDAARMYYRTNGTWNVPMVIRAPYGGSPGGGLYHSQSAEAFFAHVPGLKVVIPSNPIDAKGMLLSAAADPNPVLFLEPRRGYHTLKSLVGDGNYLIPLDSAQVTRPGNHLSLFSYGMAHSLALQAAEMASGEGISAEVVDLRSISPLDSRAILDSVRKTGKALIVSEDNLTGSVSAEVAAIIAAEAFTDLDAPVQRLCAPDVPAVPFSPPLHDWFMPSAEKILAAIQALARF